MTDTPHPADSDLRDRMVEALRAHHIDLTGNDRAQEADKCVCGVLVDDWDAHWVDTALAVRDAEVERLRAEWRDAQTGLIGEREDEIRRAVAAEAERDAARSAIDNTLWRMHQLRSWAYRDLNEEGLKNVLAVIANVLDCLDPDRTHGAALDASSAPESQETQRHIGGGANAEDCPACSGTNPPYPFTCPGDAPESTDSEDN